MLPEKGETGKLATRMMGSVDASQGLGIHQALAPHSSPESSERCWNKEKWVFCFLTFGPWLGIFNVVEGMEAEEEGAKGKEGPLSRKGCSHSPKGDNFQLLTSYTASRAKDKKTALA